MRARLRHARRSAKHARHSARHSASFGKYSRAGPGQCRAAVCEAARVYGFRPQDLEAELSAERAKFDAQKLAAQQALKQVGAKATPPIQA